MADILTGAGMSPMEMQIQQQAIDRQRALALALQQQSLTPNEGQMISGRYVAPSWTQNLSKIANGLIGKTQQSDLDTKQLGLAKQYSADQLRLAQSLIDGAQPGTANAPAQPAQPTNPLSSTPQQSTPGSYTPSAVPQSPTSQSQNTGGNPLFKGMSAPIVSNFMQAPEGALGKIAMLQMQNNSKAMEPTDLMKTMRAAGIQENSPQWQQALSQNVTKTNHIAPTSLRPGGYVENPDGTRQQLPSVPEGYQGISDGNGGWKIVPVQGGSEAVAANAVAKAAGPATFNNEKVFNPKTGAYEFRPATQIAAASGANVPGVIPPQSNPQFQVTPGQQRQRDAEAITIAQQDVANAAPQDKAQAQQALDKMNARYAAGQSVITGAANPQQVQQSPLQASPSIGSEKVANDMGEADVKYYQNLKQQGEGSKDRLNMIQGMEDLANGGTKFGPGTTGRIERLSQLNGITSGLGIQFGDKEDANVQSMQKMASNLAGQYQKALGGTGSDAQLANSIKSITNPDMFNTAIKEVAPKLKALESATQGKANGADQWIAAHGNSPQGITKYENEFRNAYDPKVYQVMNMNPEQRSAFVKSMPASDYAKFKQSYGKLQQLGAIPQ